MICLRARIAMIMMQFPVEKAAILRSTAGTTIFCPHDKAYPHKSVFTAPSQEMAEY